MPRALLSLLLAASMLTSCRSQPAIDHWILGRWEIDMRAHFELTFRSYLHRTKPEMSDAEIDALLSSEEGLSRDRGATPPMTLEGDGTGSMAGSPRGKAIVDPFR